MKKRTAVLVLATVLSLSVMGCGNSAELEQEESAETGQESNTEQEQEEETEETIKNDIPGEEVSWGYIYDEPKETDFKPNGEYYDLSESAELSIAKDTNLYDDDGSIIGCMHGNQVLNVFAVAADYVKVTVFIRGERIEVNIRHEDLEESSQFKDLFATTKQETEENDVDGTYARMVFERTLEQGGMEFAMDLMQVAEDGGAFINIPRENVGEWALAKRQEFLDKGLKCYYTEGYGWTNHTVSLRFWLGTEDENPISAEEVKAFFQTEEDLEIQKKSNIYYDLFEKVGFDSEKTYTRDEYAEFIIKMGEELGKEYNEELEQMELGSHDEFQLLQMLCDTFTYQAMPNIIFFVQSGQFGGDRVTEFCVTTGQKKDGSDYIAIRALVNLSDD